MSEDSFGSEEDFSSKKASSKVLLKKEAIIPVVVIIVVILLIVFKTSLLSGVTSIFKQDAASILVIGSPTPEFTQILSDAENKDVIKQFRIRTVSALAHNPKQRIKGYDIIILDQSLSSDKSITRTLGEAITGYVKSGGNFILVLNSGIERPGDVSVIGWKATFGDIIPVECDPTIYGVPSCKNPLYVTGVIRSVDEENKLVYGISQVPALESEGLLQTETYNVGITGKEIAYFDDARGNTYPAIVEKQFPLGKVIYFGYNPALSKAIFINTLRYLS